MNQTPSSLSTGVDIKSTLYQNVDQNVILVSEDRLKLNLINHKKHYRSKSAWQTPFGLSLSTLATLITAKFESGLGIAAATWNALFWITFFGFTFWMVWELISLFKNWNKGSDEEFIENLKKIN